MNEKQKILNSFKEFETKLSDEDYAIEDILEDAEDLREKIIEYENTYNEDCSFLERFNELLLDNDLYDSFYNEDDENPYTDFFDNIEENFDY